MTLGKHQCTEKHDRPINLAVTECICCRYTALDSTQTITSQIIMCLLQLSSTIKKISHC